MTEKPWRAAVSLVLAIGLALPARAVEVKAEPEAIVLGIQLHLENLTALGNLPELPAQQSIKTEPANAITQLPVAYIQQAYIREATTQQAPGEAAAGLIVEAVANYPSLVSRVGEALKASAPDEPATAAAVQSLWRFAADQRGKNADDPAAAARVWQRIEKLFDGKVSVPDKPLSVEPANDDGYARRKGALLAFPASVKPKRAQVDRWLKPDADTVEQTFSGVDPILASEFLELVGAPLEYHASAAAWLRTGNADAKAHLAERPDLLQAFYEIRRKHEGVLKERHNSLPELVNAYRGQGPQALKTVLDHTVEHGGDYVVQQNARTWALLSDDARDMALARMGPENFGAKTTAKLYLELTPESDLADVARRYALGRNPQGLERYLRLRLAGGKGQTVRVPLENVLPGWIRKAMERFEECTGANCVNAALGVHEDRAHQHRYVTGEEMLQTLGASFAKIDPQSELQVGDILVYTDMNKQFLHMAAYVGGDYVFNKAGASRYNPYVFQHKAVVQASYFQPDGLRLLVFRRKAL